MKDAETKLKCFELRAQGKSLNAIAATVGVRRQTVANWLRDIKRKSRISRRWSLMHCAKPVG
ncbi:MAG: helix-turn-helix domain-containing protein [Halobacteriota archaeon]